MDVCNSCGQVDLLTPPTTKSPAHGGLHRAVPLVTVAEMWSAMDAFADTQVNSPSPPPM